MDIVKVDIVKDKIEFQPLDPYPLPPMPPTQVTPQDASLSETDLNNAINSFYNHYLDSLRYSAEQKWTVGNEPNYVSFPRGEWDDGLKVEGDIGSLLENLL